MSRKYSKLVLAVSIAFLLLFESAIASVALSNGNTSEPSIPVKVQVYNGNTASVINTIFPWFKITNISAQPLDLSRVKIRYYYTEDGDRPQKYWCDWASINKDNISLNFHKMQPYGVFGRITDNAVMKLQKAKGLNQDEMVGSDIWNALRLP